MNSHIKVVRVLDVVEVVVEADIVDVPLLKFCFCEVCRGAAAQDVISHVGGPPYVLRFAGRLPAANILYEVHPVQDHPRVGDVPLPCGFYGSTGHRKRTLPAGESSFFLLLCRFRNACGESPQPSRASMRFMASTVFS